MFRKKEHDRLPALEWIGPNRLMCTVLDEMRECCKQLNFRPMSALVEEAQILANRMEAGLEDQKDLRTMDEEIHKLKKLRKELYEECKEMLEKQDEAQTKVD
jgi:predicted transcriptional regulator